ncbi:hypothetical protein ABZ667_42065 [Streptomyces lavendulae]|uniref:hypothetical protein n=1 Tax=Streptomyces lavendulae TaxID=1914 RepID=UPI0033D507AB
MSDALVGIDAIDWAELEHAYGSAEDVPGMLRDLYRPEKAADASDDLLTHVYHQGGAVYSSAPAALVYVLKAAADPAIAPTVRHELLELVGALAYAANTAEPRFVPQAWPASWDLAVTDLLPLLDDPAAPNRIAVADALAEARHRADEVIAALQARWAGEPEQESRTQLIDAVGSLIPHADAQRDDALRRDPETADTSAPLRTRGRATGGRRHAQLRCAGLVSVERCQ